MNAQQEIRAFIERQLQEKGDLDPVADADSLILMSGRLDSLDAVGIIAFLEDRFGLNFARIGFDLEQIDSIQRMSELVRTHASLA